MQRNTLCDTLQHNLQRTLPHTTTIAHVFLNIPDTQTVWDRNTPHALQHTLQRTLQHTTPIVHTNAAQHTLRNTATQMQRNTHCDTLQHKSQRTLPHTITINRTHANAAQHTLRHTAAHNTTHCNTHGNTLLQSHRHNTHTHLNTQARAKTKKTAADPCMWAQVLCVCFIEFRFYWISFEFRFYWISCKHNSN